MQMMLVRPYSMKVPKLDTNVTSSKPLGKVAREALELIPIAYHRLCGSAAMALSSGAEPPAKKYIAA